MFHYSILRGLNNTSTVWCYVLWYAR